MERSRTELLDMGSGGALEDRARPDAKAHVHVVHAKRCEKMRNGY